jgi:hypothetical protein
MNIFRFEKIAAASAFEAEAIRAVSIRKLKRVMDA